MTARLVFVVQAGIQILDPQHVPDWLFWYGVSPLCHCQFFLPCFSLQRRFAYEHPDLLDRVEDEEDSSSTVPADESGGDASIGEPARKKRRRGHAGRITKGEDFWSKVEMWFEARQKQWGDSWGSPGWSAYVFFSECLVVC